MVDNIKSVSLTLKKSSSLWVALKSDSSYVLLLFTSGDCHFTVHLHYAFHRLVLKDIELKLKEASDWVAQCSIYQGGKINNLPSMHEILYCCSQNTGLNKKINY